MESATRMTIREMKAEDIEQIVALHMRAFQAFFLTFLGPKFLSEIYLAFASDPTVAAFVAEDEQGRIVGAVAGPLEPSGYFGRLLKRRWWAFCLASVKAVLRHPTIIPRLFRAVFYRGESPKGPPRALLSCIMVDPQTQRQGLGRALVERWVKSVQKQGIRGCFLLTDAEGNDAINRFYARCGWRIESTLTRPQGRVMNRYVYDFPEGSEAPRA